MRVALYIRVSTEEQRIHGLSLEAQKNALDDYANKNNYKIVDYYTDAGITARKKINHRKDLIRLLDDVKKNRIDLILFTKLDRWFRNISDYYKVQEVLDQNGVNWKAIYEDYDTLTANGRLHVNIMLSIAQDEADRTSERIKTVFEAKRSRKEWTCGIPPTGYKYNSETKHLDIDPETSKIVSAIFNHYQQSHSMWECVKYIQDYYSYHLTQRGVAHILENRAYIGEFHEIQDYIPAIIAKKQFDLVQNINTVRKTSYTSGTNGSDERVYLFSGILKCSECGRMMTSVFTRQMNKDGMKEYHYYVCRKYRDDRDCEHKNQVNENTLEKYLLKNMKHLMETEINAKISPKAQIDYENKRSQLIAKLKRLNELYIDGFMDKVIFTAEHNKIKADLESIPEKFESKKIEQLINSDIEGIYNTLSPKAKRVFWHGIIKMIQADKYNNFRVTFLT